MNDQSDLLRDALTAIDSLQARLDAVEARSREPIAILGMGCRYPGGVIDPESFWQLVSEGIDAVAYIPADRWDADAWHDPTGLPGKMVAAKGGFLDNIREFDPGFFGITPREARLIDPQQRMLLETTHEAVERAGLSARALSGRSIGVFVGATSNDFANIMREVPLEDGDIYSINGGGLHAAAGRVAFTFGFMGPCITLDTACSSSLAAVHLACQSLRTGESEMAIAGGANVIFEPRGAVVFSHGGVMAADGTCKAFDAAADGFVRSEGCAMIVLKRLSDALRDEDPIAAVIRGSAVNSDGRSAGLTQPYGPAQEALLRRALASGGLEPADIDYIEAHGTGTPIGDPIEVEALANVLGEGRPADRPLVLGSVKTNIGHPEAASGMAGLIKTVMALQHEAIPPTLHFNSPNPMIDWARQPVRVADVTLPWSRGDRKRRAGISSFGFSGTNAHVIVEEAPAAHAAPATAPAAGAPVVVPFSAAGPQALQALAGKFGDWLDRHDTIALDDVALTLGVGRSHLSQRAALVARDMGELREGLRTLARGEVPPGAAMASARGTQDAGVAFLFTGQGSQYAGMGRALYAAEPVFRATIDRAAAILAPILDRPLLDVLFAEGADAPLINATAYTQPALFAIECALADLWRSWGITPAVVLGHSVGEYSAACVAGVFGFEDGLKLIAERGRLMQALPAGGAMAAVFASEARVAAAIAGHADRLAIAAANGPEEIVVSGEKAALDTVLAALAAEGVEARRLEVSHAFHSPLLDPMLDALEKRAAEVTFHAPSIPLVSNVTGTLFAAGTGPDAGYWRRHARGAVRFAASLETLAGLNVSALIEVGPHPTLLGLAAASAVGGVPMAASLRRGREDRAEMLAAVRDLYVAGATIDWRALPGARDGHRVALPTYAFQRAVHWHEYLATGQKRRPGTSGHPLLGERQWSPGGDIGFLSEISTAQPRFIADHVVHGVILVPGAAFIETIFAAARELGIARAIRIERLVFEKALQIEGDEIFRLHTTLTRIGRNRYDVVIRSQLIDDGVNDDGWDVHVRGTVSEGSAAALPGTVAYADTIPTGDRTAEDHYRSLDVVGLSFGPSFQVVAEPSTTENGARALLDGAPVTRDGMYVMHPALIDGGLQVIALCSPDEQGALFVPIAIDELVLHGRPVQQMRATATLLETMDSRAMLRAAIRIEDPDGAAIMTIRGFVGQAVTAEQFRTSGRGMRLESLSLGWRPATEAAGGEPADRYLLVGGPAALAETLSAAMAAQGMTAEHVPAPDATLADDAARAAALGLDAGTMVVALDALVPTEGAEPAAAEATYLRMLTLAKTVAASDAGLALLTRGAEAIAPGDEIALAQAPLVGLIRSLNVEQPHAPRLHVDLDPGTAPDPRLVLSALAAAGAAEPAVALRHGAVQVPRVTRRAAPARELDEPTRTVLSITERGDLDGLFFDEQPRIAPGPGEIEIEVRAAGMNFRDVLNALGMYPPPVPPLGSEAAGIVTAIGAGVTRIAVGDEVVGIAPDSFGSHCTFNAQMAVAKPPSITFAEAVTIPNTYLTALLCLKIADLKPGQRVLVHAAAGGVGSAAVKLARHFGLEVYATAGNPEKRAYALARGATAVFDSRSTAFANELLAATNGEGVDLVINSLAAEFIAAGFRVLRPGGCFVEIGKQGVWTIEEAAERAPGIRYSVEDLGADILTKPDEVRADFEMVMKLAGDGAIDPLPLRVFPLSGAKDAFRHMANARHIGKLVLVPDTWAPPARIRADGTYIVTGGLGGIGRKVVEWLAADGAGEIVLLGRRAPGAEQQAFIDTLAAAGGRVRAVACDVADPDAVAALWRDVLPGMPPVRGIVHGAGVLADAPFDAQDAERWATVAAPKLAGAWNLHTAAARDPLDFFVTFSSTSALFGSAGQVNYAAANAWLDGLAAYRRLRGLPALSIAWGPWAEVGMAADMADQQARWEKGGLGLIEPAAGIAAMAAALGHADPYVAISMLNLRRLAATASGGAAAMLDAGAKTGAADQGADRGGESSAALAAFKAADPADQALRTTLLQAYIHEEVARVLGFSPGALDANTSLAEAGLDSLMAVQLRNTLMRQLATDLPVKELLKGPSVAQLAILLGTLAADADAEPEAAAEWEEGAL